MGRVRVSARVKVKVRVSVRIRVKVRVRVRVGIRVRVRVRVRIRVRVRVRVRIITIINRYGDAAQLLIPSLLSTSSSTKRPLPHGTAFTVPFTRVPPNDTNSHDPDSQVSPSDLHIISNIWVRN